MNAITAQYIAGKDGKTTDNLISGWTRLTCAVFSLFTLQWLKTKNHSHSEGGWQVFELVRQLVMVRKFDILDELIATVKDFPVIKTETEYQITDAGERYLFFSAASRMGGEGTKAGTRFIMDVNLLDHTDRWDLYGKQLLIIHFIGSFYRAWQQRGKGYDWWGVLLGFCSTGALAAAMGKALWYCSEVVYYMWNGKIIRISPRRFGAWLASNGWYYLGDPIEAGLLKQAKVT